MSRLNQKSMYLSFLLRHHPEAAGLTMDKHGWVSVEQLLMGLNDAGVYRMDWEELQEIVSQDKKGRYRFDEKRTKIKACQGHSIPWIELELEYKEPPEFLYHGTTVEAWREIQRTGAILKMSRHAVHLQAEKEKAWKSALRWKKTPILLKIAAGEMAKAGMVFGKSENDVWCTEQVPVEYVVEKLYGIKK